MTRSHLDIERALLNFQPVKIFRDTLEKVIKSKGTSKTWKDSRRKCELADYLSVYLFSLFNPVLESMRGICAVSHLDKVKQKVCSSAISLGTFSESQHLVDLELLEAVFGQLQANLPADKLDEKLLSGRTFQLIDSSIWRVYNRLTWAHWRAQTGGGSSKADSAVRLHTVFDLAKGIPSKISLTEAKVCERKQWKELARPGDVYIGDRFYGTSYKLLSQMIDNSVDFIVRLRTEARWVVDDEIKLTNEDRANDIVWSGWVFLETKGNGPKVRIVQFAGAKESIIIATSLNGEDFCASDIRILYKHRWEIEYFFHWVKCILKNRHWFCESPEGLQLQSYLILIAAVLLMLFTRKRPNKRTMELIQFYISGSVSEDELAKHFNKITK